MFQHSIVIFFLPISFSMCFGCSKVYYLPCLQAVYTEQSSLPTTKLFSSPERKRNRSHNLTALPSVSTSCVHRAILTSQNKVIHISREKGETGHIYSLTFHVYKLCTQSNPHFPQQLFTSPERKEKQVTLTALPSMSTSCVHRAILTSQNKVIHISREKGETGHIYSLTFHVYKLCTQSNPHSHNSYSHLQREKKNRSH